MASRRQRIWITRAQPGAEVTAERVRALGLSKAVVKPLARTRLAAKVFPPFPLEGALLNLIDRRP